MKKRYFIRLPCVTLSGDRKYYNHTNGHWDLHEQIPEEFKDDYLIPDLQCAHDILKFVNKQCPTAVGLIHNGDFS